MKYKKKNRDLDQDRNLRENPRKRNLNGLQVISESRWCPRNSKEDNIIKLREQLRM